MRRRILYIITLLFFSFQFTGALAQVPQKMSYQAIVRNANNNLVTNAMIGMRISIVQGSESGTAVYIETHTAKTNTNGLVTLAIGDGSPVRGTFQAISWAEGSFFVRTETDPSGGTNYTITGVSQLMSVPFALYAVSSGSGSGLPGKSAYEIWKAQPGNANKTETDFIAAMKGDAGTAGEKGDTGKSVYDIWKAQAGNGNKTEADFIAAMKGEKGDKGEAGTGGTGAGEKGEKGDKGDKGDVGGVGPTGEAGAKGDPGLKGDAGLQGEKGEKGEKGDTGAKGEAGTNGADGKSAFESWIAFPGNENKSMADFILALKGDPGVKGEPGLKGDAGEKGEKGEKGDPGTGSGGIGEKGERGEKGDTGEQGVKGDAGAQGEKGVQGDKGADGAAGKSAYELWKEIDGNENKTIEEYQTELKGKDGKTVLNGTADPDNAAGKSGDFYINTGTLTLFGPKAEDGTWPVGVSLKGVDAIGFDFKGSYTDLNAYKAVAENTETLNKAYYNITDKKSYVHNGTEWKVFAQDGGDGTGGDLKFNVDRNITRKEWPLGLNLGRGKTTAQFLEEVFFPRLAATKPVITIGPSTTFPYSEWKSWTSLTKNVNLNWTVTNTSKQNDSDDKDITSIRLLLGATEVATAVPDNSGAVQNGVFNAVEFKKVGGSNKTDFSQTYTFEVKDAEPNTVTASVTLTMNKAIQLTVNAPTLNTSKYEYEYSNTDIPLNLSWSINKGDEVITDISVDGKNTGSTATSGTTPVVFKSPANGGAPSQQFTLGVTGDIYGAATAQKSPLLKWVNTSYYGSFSSTISPCNGSFNITDDQVKALTPLLGGTLKGDTGFDFTYNISGQYTVFAYPDDAKTPVVEYFDTITGKWLAYPSAQIKEINRANFKNASGYTGTNYKIILVCVEYRDAAAKVRIK